MWTRKQLSDWVKDARQRTCDLVADLNDGELIGPRLSIINPLLWEIGHVAWFQEKWVLRHAGQQKPLRPDADALYDSAAIAHDTRWDLPLPGRQETLRYLAQVRDRVLDRLYEGEFNEQDIYFTLLSVFHEDMHAEAILCTRQVLAYPPPQVRDESPKTGPDPGGSIGQPLPVPADDARVPGGTVLLGTTADEPFVFDNEKWAHPVELPAFAMARAPVTQGEFAAFVDDGGYVQDRFWSAEGLRWREGEAARHPVYWQREAGGRWLRRQFDRWLPLESRRPMMHVNWYEAEAFCRWSGRRLPLESEWEAAASAMPTTWVAGAESSKPRRVGGTPGGLEGKRRFPWGNEPPTARHAHLDGRGMGCVEVDCLPGGDSAFGCRQMIGNVWEWTARDFLPYPGFIPDPYKEYSAPWFGTHKVLRGGCWATQSRLLRNTFRNFYRPERRDIWAGFRTCAPWP